MSELINIVQESDVRDNPFSFLDDWYGRLDDIIEDLKDHGFAVLNATAGWIDVSDADEKEYVLKLGGTEKTITIDKIESLNESIDSEKELCDKIVKQYLDGDVMSKIAADLNVTRADVKVCVDEYMSNRKKNKSIKKDESLNCLTEGGIYPVTLIGGADDAFLKVINEILGGDISEVYNLELIPSLGFGSGGRYWYKACIVLDEDTVVNFITAESTPEAKRLLDNGSLIINPYSDINIDCSANNVQYHDGTTLDALNDSDADMKILDNESNIIGEAIISKLVEAEDKIIEVLKKYEDTDDEEDVDLYESLIPIEEENDEFSDDELASIYGGDTAQSQKDIENDYKETYLWYGKYERVFSKRGKDKIVKVMFEFDSEDYDEAMNEFESIIPEPYTECKLLGKLIYGISTYKRLNNEGFKMIKSDTNGFSKLETIDDWVEPKLGRKIKQLKGWKIYKGTDSSGDEIFRCFTPDDDYPTVGYEDWECETLEQAISWIQNYDLEESNNLIKNSNNLNKDKAKIAYDNLLNTFDGTDIKYTNEDYVENYYQASIKFSTKYIDFINDVRNNWEKTDDSKTYLEYEDFGYKQVNFEYESDEETISRINIYVEYEDDDLIIIESTNNESEYEKAVYEALDDIEFIANGYTNFSLDDDFELLNHTITVIEERINDIKQIIQKTKNN